MELIDALNWRYAAKRMTGEKVPQEKIDRILEATRLAASSAGLQPYSVIVISNPELLKKIQPIAHNQPQIAEASHLLVFAAWDNLTTQHIDNYMQLIADTRNVPVDTLVDFSNRLKGFTQRDAETNFGWAARQSYIALGTALVAAALEQVDATPMEGFVNAEMDEALGLREKGLRSVSIMAIGYRDAEKDFLASAKKVRRPKDELFISFN